MGLTPADLQDLLAAFEESSWQEMTVSVAGDSLHVSRRDTAAGAAAPAAAGLPASSPAVPPPPPPPPHVPAPDASDLGSAPPGGATPSDGAGAGTAAGPRDASGTPVVAPSVGLFWRAPSPGAPPFVEVGTRVDAEATIGIVEVMKLMNQVPAGMAGVVTAVLVENGGMVEHGQPLVLIDPKA